MTDLESKIEQTKAFLKELDKAVREKQEDTMKELIKNYVRENIINETSASALPYIGTTLLDANLILNGQKIPQETVDRVFNLCLKFVERVKLPEGVSAEDVIYNAKILYNEKKAEVLLYSGVEDLDKGDAISANKKLNKACELSNLTDEQRSNLEKGALKNLEEGNIREFVYLYGGAGKDAAVYFEQHLDQLKALRDKYCVEALDAIAENPAGEKFDRMNNFYLLADNLYTHLTRRLHND